VVTNDWNLHTAQCWWSNWGVTRTLPNFYLQFASFRFTISPFCFRALTTLGTETPANPDVNFLIYCTDNQEYFSKYVLRTLRMIRLVPKLMGLVLFMFPSLLLATLLLPLWIGLQVLIIPIFERVKYWWRITCTTVTKINITFISRLPYSAPYKPSARDMCLRNWPTSCLAIMLFVKESVELFGKQVCLFVYIRLQVRLNWKKRWHDNVR
jgi:hypothetical protein